MTSTDVFDIDALLVDQETKIIVCCGSGGVGKTTMSAALALRAAELGRTVCVLTIDPARRMAQSLGLTSLDNNPRTVSGVSGGRLDAMMLDMKRTFDEVVLAHASGEKAEQILNNPFYIALSSSFAGTQEYMAMEKLSQLHSAEDKPWDLIVVDTPPSRSALDFLDAPERLSSLLDGRFIRILLAPTKGPARLMSAGMGVVTRAMNKVIGAQLLTDVQTFIAAFDTLFGGFRQRAEETYSLLKGPNTAFIVVAAPETDALREASYFVERLSEDSMPLSGMIVNRTSVAMAKGLSPELADGAAERLSTGRADEQLVAGLLRLHAVSAREHANDMTMIHRFSASHPEVKHVIVPAFGGDISDLEGLRAVGALLAKPKT